MSTADPEQVHAANGWATRWIGRGRRVNHARLVEFLGIAIAHEPDAVLRIAQRIAQRHHTPRTPTEGT